MEKKVYFLFSPPRTGNTLLGSILNQNKDVCITANSVIPDIVERLVQIKRTDLFLNFPDEESLDNTINNIRENYYKQWKQKYIIERGSCGNSFYFNNLKFVFKNNLKSITLVRPLFDIIKSFMFWYKNNDTILKNFNFSSDEQKIEFLLNQKTIPEIITIKAFQSHKYNLFIEYDNLIKKPEKTINEIYNFLNIKKFKHDFKKLNQLNINDIKYNDETFGDNLHTIKTKGITKTKRNIKDIIPKIIIKQSDKTATGPNLAYHSRIVLPKPPYNEIIITIKE